jgi:hypothetical protein
MSDLILSILGLILGWSLIGTASAFLIAVAFFGIREEKNLEENNHDL